MGLIEGLFPDVMMAEHLKEISETIKNQNLRSFRKNGRLIEKLNRLAEDRDSMALIIYALIVQLVDNGLLKQDDLIEKIKEIDNLDTLLDGKYPLRFVKKSLGIRNNTGKRCLLKNKRRTKRR